MGFALFTSSGTFNPSTYGLSPGDLIHIKCVGGGAGGGQYDGSSSYPGNAGQASSFGSVLSAAGGSVPSYGATVNPIVAGSDPGGAYEGEYISFTTTTGGSQYTYQLYGSGTGGGGWHPQYGFVPSPISALTFMPLVSANAQFFVTLKQSVEYMLHGRHVNMSAIDTSAASTLPFGYAGGGNYSYYSNVHYYVMSAGGIGYGAGGGGGCVYNSGGRSANSRGLGGNGGVIADLDYVLPNSDSYAITVGNGGAGRPPFYSGQNYYRSGGGGARGCVAIWW